MPIQLKSTTVYRTLAAGVAILMMAQTNGARFIPVGLPKGSDILEYTVGAISGDEQWVVGTTSLENGDIIAYRWNWTAGGEPELIGGFDNGDVISGNGTAFPMSVNGVSYDGSVIVGRDFIKVRGDDRFRGREARWTQETGWETLLQSPPLEDAVVSDVSDDGSVIVGNSDNGAAIWRWKSEEGAVTIDYPLGSMRGWTAAVSGDGAVIVGRTLDDGTRAFRWTADTGAIDLGVLSGHSASFAHDVSDDGAVIVGRNIGGDPYYEGFRWTEETGMVSLGTKLAGDLRISGNGQVIVSGAYIWDSAHGVRRFEEVMIRELDLAQHLAGWSNLRASDVSTSGNVLVGSGTNPSGHVEGWILDLAGSAVMPGPPGNFNGDTVIDGADFLEWQRGLGANHSANELGLWQANYGQHRLLGVVGQPVSSAILSSNNELDSFVVDGVTYLQEDLIPAVVTEFIGGGESTYVITGSGDPAPAPGERSSVVGEDFRLDTALGPVAEDPAALRLSFESPLVNGPGPDLLLVSLVGASALKLQVQLAEGFVFDSSWGDELVELEATGHTLSPAATGLNALETGELQSPFEGPLRSVGVAIDFDELGIAAMASVSEIALSAVDENKVYPILMMGINSAGQLPGDFDFNGAVNGDDFLTWQRGLGGQFSAADLLDWQAGYGAGSSLANTQVAVPEPSSLLLCNLALAGGFTLKRRCSCHQEEAHP